MSNVAIAGIGQTQYTSRRDDVIYPELVREAAELALDDCGLSVVDIDAVVFSLAPDGLIGVGNAERWCVEAIGASGKPLMRVNTGGSTGISSVQTGFYHVASGMFETVLVLGADRVAESGDAQTVLNKMWDIGYERPYPLNAVNMLALSAQRYMAKYGTTEYHMALVAAKNRRHAARNPHAHLRKLLSVDEVLASKPICWPIKMGDACPQSTGGAAVVLVSERVADRMGRPVAWVRGLGVNAETFWMGDRVGPQATGDHADADGLALALERAYRGAGIRSPARQLQVAELYAPFSSVELHAIEAARLCAKGDAGRRLEYGEFELGSRGPVVNPSGGVMNANPIAVTALVRVAEAALQVTGRAGDRQVAEANVAVSSGIGGDHEFYGAMVLANHLREIS
jgi:acetyl-CoA C-acetyltransferase